MRNKFTVPDKFYNVEIRECNIVTNTVIGKYEITVAAETRVEAFQKGMQHCILMMAKEHTIIYFPKSVKLSD